jgi:Domain of unknown function (DUF4417)
VYQLPLNTFYQPVLSDAGFPLISSFNKVPDEIFPYKLRTRHVPIKNYIRGMHFFLEDWKFENVWKYPTRSLDYLRKADCVIAPDFSLMADWPHPLKIWNTYRNRWISSYWQSQGINVIPCVSWCDKESYKYCFDSLPKNSVLAIASMGVKKRSESEELFFQGVEKMVEILNPKKVIVYGTKFQNSFDNSDLFKFYPWYQKYRR